MSAIKTAERRDINAPLTLEELVIFENARKVVLAIFANRPRPEWPFDIVETNAATGEKRTVGLKPDAVSPFIFYGPEAPKEERLMEWLHMLTEEEARAHLVKVNSGYYLRTNYTERTTFRHFITVDNFTLQFMDVIDPEANAYANLQAMIEHDTRHGLGHAQFMRQWIEEGLV